MNNRRKEQWVRRRGEERKGKEVNYSINAVKMEFPVEQECKITHFADESIDVVLLLVIQALQF